MWKKVFSGLIILLFAIISSLSWLVTRGSGFVDFSFMVVYIIMLFFLTFALAISIIALATLLQVGGKKM